MTDKCYIRTNKLLNDNIGFTLYKLDERENTGNVIANSALQTPTVQEIFSDEPETSPVNVASGISVNIIIKDFR